MKNGIELIKRHSMAMHGAAEQMMSGGVPLQQVAELVEEIAVRSRAVSLLTEMMIGNGAPDGLQEAIDAANMYIEMEDQE